MKTLFLVRHAKSSWNDLSVSDRDRPLDDRGVRDVEKLSERLEKRNLHADLIMTSPAVRTRATADALAKSFDVKRKHIVVNDRMYACGWEELLAIIRGLDDDYDTTVLVGHNPGVTDLAHQLYRNITDMPTCAIAEFVFNTKTWTEIGASCLGHVAFDSPKTAAHR